MARSSSFSLVSSLAATIFDPLRGLRILRVSLPLAFQQPTFHRARTLRSLLSPRRDRALEIDFSSSLFVSSRFAFYHPQAARNETLPSLAAKIRGAIVEPTPSAFRILSFFFLSSLRRRLSSPPPLPSPLLRRLACLHPLVNPSIPRESIDFLASYEVSERPSRNPCDCLVSSHHRFVR